MAKRTCSFRNSERSKRSEQPLVKMFVRTKLSEQCLIETLKDRRETNSSYTKIVKVLVPILWKRPVLHSDLSAHRGLSFSRACLLHYGVLCCSRTCLHTGAELQQDVSAALQLCCTRTCLHTGAELQQDVSALQLSCTRTCLHQDASALQSPIMLHLDGFPLQGWLWATPGRVWTTVSCAAPELSYTTETCAAHSEYKLWPELHIDVSTLQSTVLHIDMSTSQEPELHLDMSTPQGWRFQIVMSTISKRKRNEASILANFSCRRETNQLIPDFIKNKNKKTMHMYFLDQSEEKQMYSFLNYETNIENRLYLFLNYSTKQENWVHSFFNYGTNVKNVYNWSWTMERMNKNECIHSSSIDDFWYC
jgi:hypothetical protein